MSRGCWVNKQQQTICNLVFAGVSCTREDEKHAFKIEAEKQKKKLAKYILEASDTPGLPFEKLGLITLFFG